MLYTFTHSGSMHRWGDRWLEGGSETDSWNNTGSNAAIQGGWADLCAGWRWQANAGVNFDIGSLYNDVKAIISAVETIIQIVAVVARLNQDLETRFLRKLWWLNLQVRLSLR